MSQAHAALPGPPNNVATTGVRTFEVTAVHTDASHATIRLHGEMDVANADLAATVLEDQLASGHRFVLLDLSRLTFMDCAGLRVLVRAHHDLLAARGTLVMSGVGPRITRLLRITGLDQVLARDRAIVVQPSGGQQRS